MTILFAIKDKGKIYLATDGAASRGRDRKIITDPSKYKVTLIKGSENCFIAGTGSVNSIDILKKEDDLLDGKTDISFSYVVKHIVPKMFYLEDRAGFSEIDEDGTISLGCGVIFFTKSKLFQINNYGVVVEIDNYAIDGCGKDLAYAAYLSLKDKYKDDPKKLVTEVVRTVIDKGDCFDYPLCVAGNDGTYEVITS